MLAGVHLFSSKLNWLYRLSFQVSRLLESNDNINTFLTSYKHYEPYETQENEDKKLHVMVSNEM